MTRSRGATSSRSDGGGPSPDHGGDGAVSEVRAVLERGGGPLCEVGRVTATDRGQGLLVVAGDLGVAQWRGFDASDLAGSGVSSHPVAVYDAEGRDCRSVMFSRLCVNAVRVHPSLPLAAVATGYVVDGDADGELILLDLRTGAWRSVLDEWRMVVDVAWRSGEELEALLVPLDAEDADGELEQVVMRRKDWSAVAADEIEVEELPVTLRRGGRPGAGREAPSGGRRLVWAVRALADGGVLACSEGVGLERWSAEGERLWAVGVDGVGCQLSAAGDGRGALVVVDCWEEVRWGDEDVPSELLRVDLAGGRVVARMSEGVPWVASFRRDGTYALRDVVPEWTIGEVALTHDLWVGGPAASPVRLGKVADYDVQGDYLGVADCPEILLLTYREDGRRPARRWVTQVDVDRGDLVPLFPLDWDGESRGVVLGGPGLFHEDSAGRGLIQAGGPATRWEGPPGAGFVARRRFPDGRLEWVQWVQATVTGVASHGDAVVAVENSGGFVVLDVLTGERLAEGVLRSPQGHPVIPLCCDVTGSGDVVVGCLDGRLLTFEGLLPGRLA